MWLLLLNIAKLDDTSPANNRYYLSSDRQKSINSQQTPCLSAPPLPFFPIEGQEEACQDTDSVYSKLRFASLNEWSMAGTQALFRHENFVQTARLFCVRIFLVANKPSISRFAKNHQVADNQPFAKNSPLPVRQKPPKSYAFTR